MRSTTAIVMAGRREGSIDPLAAAAGLADKCLVPVAGRPMIEHVLMALADTPSIARIIVSINDPALLDAVPAARALIDEGRLVAVRAKHNLVDSLFAAIDGQAFPILVTTADNVLLTPAAVEQIGTAGDTAGAKSVAVAFTRRASVLAAHPDGQRRFYRFRDDSYSNCNAYWIGSPAALAVAEVFRSGGQFAKHPVRILRALGLYNLIAFRLGLGTIDGAFARFSRRFGFPIRAVILDDGAVAIDVDNPRTLAVAETIFASRKVSQPALETAHAE
ncbi:NTP transferase domain-containing protein [Sphingomonas prati]|uniref:GTP:adenosylcobinamide-phosphate guanylyltransferase n=1 Tax=Sphingomonas prati TaxID=1843237 RepID=A0A7W9BQ77_9SPHN|nr:NTP transferase domain-containing protein [Sphingomonas prati]MBB5728099.1 GTP:adenosylcobinamide-phosphate guanylyltransferase [Sphingomonas prati]